MSENCPRESISQRVLRWETTGAFAVTLVLYGSALSLSHETLAGGTRPCVFGSAITMAWVAAYRAATLWTLGRRFRLQFVAFSLFAVVLTYHIVRSFL
jgi:membrane protein implicated in regulation of membrane protease activity